MYHYITIWSLVINMTWLWVIVFLAVFLGVLNHEAKRRWLNFWSFLRFLPVYILIIYFCGTYLHYFIDQFSIFPVSIDQILRYFSPYQYNFSTIWIILWMILGWWKFLKVKEKKDAWVHSFLYATLWGMVPLGIFLLLWDSFIGLPTNGGFYVSAIRSDSFVAIYDKVIPLGFYFSLLGLIGWSIMFIFHRSRKPSTWWGGFALLTFLLSFLYIFQQYDKRLVSELWSLTIDIKQYFLWIVAVAFLFIWWKSQKQQ